MYTDYIKEIARKNDTGVTGMNKHAEDGIE